MPAFSNKWTFLLLVIFVGVVLWHQFGERDLPTAQETQKQLPNVTPPAPTSPASPLAPATAEAPVAPTPPATVPPVAATPVPAAIPPATAGVVPGPVHEIPASREDIAEDLSAVDAAIRNFQTVHGENPIGTNAQITSALLGNNPKQLKLEVPVGSHVNGEGEMCDRWGTPYFFHQLSATAMEIRSAGPDRKMWTSDDSQM